MGGIQQSFVFGGQNDVQKRTFFCGTGRFGTGCDGASFRSCFFLLMRFFRKMEGGCLLGKVEEKREGGPGNKGLL